MCWDVNRWSLVDFFNLPGSMHVFSHLVSVKVPSKSHSSHESSREEPLDQLLNLSIEGNVPFDGMD